MSEKLIVGLGNPGSKYALTRHNIGFILLQAFAKENQWTFKAESKFQGHLAQGIFGEHKVYLLLPMTYMNLSGQSVRKVVDYYHIAPSDLLVISDDIALDFLQIRLRSMGGAGGHRGLQSVQSCLGSNQYPRLRIGIGDREVGSLEDYVLSQFSVAELSQLEELSLKSSAAIQLWLKERIDIAMNIVNKVPKPNLGESQKNQIGEEIK